MMSHDIVGAKMTPPVGTSAVRAPLFGAHVAKPSPHYGTLMDTAAPNHAIGAQLAGLLICYPAGGRIEQEAPSCEDEKRARRACRHCPDPDRPLHMRTTCGST
jgi:hypothetical protein